MQSRKAPHKASLEPNDKDAACFICGSLNSFKTAYSGIYAEGRTFGVEFCASCGVGRTEPFLDEKELERLYSGVDYRESDAKRFPLPVEKAVAFLRRTTLKRVERYSKPDSGAKAVLDVGCGRGDFLQLMASSGWRAVGLELDSRAPGRGKAMGIDLRNASIEDAGFNSSIFDAVTFWHVFEHIRKPVSALDKCRSLLKPGGLLVVAVPNAGSFQASFAGRHWFHLDPPFHLYHYNADNLKKLLDKAGFDVVSIKHFSMEYGPYGWLQSIYNVLGFKRNLLYDFLRSRAEKNIWLYASMFVMALLAPVIAPLSVLLSFAEALSGRGGTIEIYATKR